VNVGLFARDPAQGDILLRAAIAAGHVVQLLSGEPPLEPFDAIVFDGFPLAEVAERAGRLALGSYPAVQALAGLSPAEAAAFTELHLPIDDVYPAGNAGGFVLRLAIAERRRQQEGLTAAVRLEQANDAIYSIDFAGRFTSANAATEALTGYHRRDLIGMPIATVIAPDFLDYVTEQTARKRSGAADSTIFEFEIVRPDGERRRLETSSRLLTVDGVPVGVQGIARDVTSIRRLEGQLLREHEALAAARAQLAAVFESSSEGIVVIDADLNILLENARAREHARTFFGGASAEGRDFQQRLTPDERNAFKGYVERALAGERFVTEWRQQSLAGGWAWFESSYSPVQLDDGGHVGVAIVWRDVTEQRQLLADVAEREATLSAVFASINEGITLMDRDMRFVLANQLALERSVLFTGNRPEAGRHMSAYIRPQEWEKFTELFAQALGGEHVTVSGRFDDPETGEERWTEYNYHPVRGVDGEVAGVARVSRDITRARRAERALRRADKYNRALVENTPDALFVLDVSGEPGDYTFRVAMANAAFGQLTGLDPERIQGRLVADIFKDAEIYENSFRCYMEAITARRTIEYEEVIPWADRPEVLTTLTPLLDAQGFCYRLIGSSRDITERKRLEREERSARERAEGLARIVESTSDAIISLDLDRRVVFWNASAERIYGYPAAEAFGQHITSLFPPGYDPDAFARGDAERDSVYAGNQIVSMRTHRRRSDGSIFEALVSAFPLRDSDGAVVGIASASTDITEQLRAEAAIRERNADLDAVFASSLDALVLLDTDGRVLRLNPAGQHDLEALNGAGDFIGRPWSEVMPPDGKPELPELLRRAKAGETVSLERTTSIGPRQRTFDVSYAAVQLEDGSLRGVLVTGRDITERKRAADSLVRTQKLESLAVLAGGIAHDFNNLLVGILGNAGIALSELPATSPARETIEAIETAGQRAAELARQMLAYSGRGKIVVQDASLNDLVSEMTHLLKVSIGKRIALRLDLATDLPFVQADATQLRQVIMNLVVNASDAIGANDGAITVRTGSFTADTEALRDQYLAPELTPGEYVLLEVEDSGMGMNEETLARIFDPFFTTKFTGRGLGLAAVLGIVRGHRGAIKVDSVPGEGTTFRLLFPVSATATPPAEAKVAPAPWKGTGAVLVVDDEPTVRAVTVRALRAFGFETLEAEDGQAGVDVYAANRDRIVAVLLDMTMPRLNGEETFRALQAIDPGVRVILMSGFTEQDTTGKFAGLAAFIQKPYELATLREAVRAAVEQTHVVS